MRKAVPVLFTLTFTGCFYYFYFSIYSNKAVLAFDKGLCFFHIFLFLSSLSLLQIILSDPGKVPKSFELSEIPEYEKEESPEEIIPKYYLLGRVGFCVQCRRDRPHRAHHCEKCGSCVMRYDHHCLFLGSCIGLKSVKLFILYLFYSFLACIVSCIDCASLMFSTELSLKLFLFILLSSIFSVFFLVLTLTNLANVCLNVTAVEFKWKAWEMFDCGLLLNIKQVFGETYALWLVPVETSDQSGLRFPMKIRLKSTEDRLPFSKYLI